MPTDLEKIKPSHAYWLSPKGKIYNVDTKHIHFVRDNLELFKLTQDKYQEYYKKHKEPFGWEGKAREEIFIQVMSRGWCRIRDYANKGWSVEVWEMDNYTKDLLFKWAGIIKGFIKEHIELNESYFYNYNIVNIHIIKLEQQKKPMPTWLINTSFDEILQGKLYENNNKLKNLLDFNLFENILNESSVSRIWQHIKNNKSFGVISPFRSFYSEEENNDRFIELKKDVRKLKYGFIETIGGFNEHGIIVKEKSMFIPNIKKEDLFKLGVKYQQISVIYKDDKEFIEIETENKSGKILNTFDRLSDKNLSIESDVVKDFFTQIAKGSHKDKKFLFKLEEMFLYEVIELSFNEIAYSKKKIDIDNKTIKLI